MYEQWRVRGCEGKVEGGVRVVGEGERRKMFCFSANCTSAAKSNGVKSGLMVACIIQHGGKMQMVGGRVL